MRDASLSLRLRFGSRAGRRSAPGIASQNCFNTTQIRRVWPSSEPWDENKGRQTVARKSTAESQAAQFSCCGFVQKIASGSKEQPHHQLTVFDRNGERAMAFGSWRLGRRGFLASLSAGVAGLAAQATPITANDNEGIAQPSPRPGSARRPATYTYKTVGNLE